MLKQNNKKARNMMGAQEIDYAATPKANKLVTVLVQYSDRSLCDPCAIATFVMNICVLLLHWKKKLRDTNFG